MQAATAILPIIALVAIGYAARRWKIIASHNWPGIEQLGFRLLLPAILLTSIYRANLSPGTLGAYILAVVIAFGLTGAACFLMRRRLRLSNPRLTSMAQAALRFNSLLVLAIAAQALGSNAQSDLAVTMALLIPAFNITAIIVLTLFPSEDTQADQTRTASRASQKILVEILRNPLVIGCVIGLSLNLSGWDMPAWVVSPLDWLGQGALAVGLLTVGAGIELRRLWQTDSALWIGVALRLIICPALFLVMALFFGLMREQLLSGLLLTAAPTASAGYILARQMGGDADFFAAMFTWQTIISALTLPLWLMLGAQLSDQSQSAALALNPHISVAGPAIARR